MRAEAIKDRGAVGNVLVEELAQTAEAKQRRSRGEAEAKHGEAEFLFCKWAKGTFFRRTGPPDVEPTLMPQRPSAALRQVRSPGLSCSPRWTAPASHLREQLHILGSVAFLGQSLQSEIEQHETEILHPRREATPKR